MTITKAIFIPLRDSEGQRFTKLRWADQERQELEEAGFRLDHEITIRSTTGEPEYRQIYFTKEIK